ncbi:hypothetical protein LTR17_013944 [Elasticomyces elasticus]|nr:hypothetical protein LTR17_013944 [Elasticomyces elasticus]
MLPREKKADREKREKNETNEARINASLRELREQSDHLREVPAELLNQIRDNDNWRLETDIAEYFRQAQQHFPLIFGHLSLGNDWDGATARRRLERMLLAQHPAGARTWENYQARRRAFERGDDPARIRFLEAAQPMGSPAASATPAAAPATPKREGMLAYTPLSAHNVASSVQDALAGFRKPTPAALTQPSLGDQYEAMRIAQGMSREEARKRRKDFDARPLESQQVI